MDPRTSFGFTYLLSLSDAPMHETIIILDFGSQYTQLIARRVREAGVYSEIHPCTIPTEEVAAMHPKGIILSGGPCSVYDAEAPQLDDALLAMRRDDGGRVPVLGICYGLQAMAHLLAEMSSGPTAASSAGRRSSFLRTTGRPISSPTSRAGRPSG